MYADFTHDNQMTAIAAAMGLFDDSRSALDPASPDDARSWVVSEIVPFAGRFVVEKMRCGREAEERVRVLVNDAVQRLKFCEGAGEDGLCALDKFVESQAWARNSGDGLYEQCFP